MSETVNDALPEEEGAPASSEGQEEPSQPRDDKGRFQKPAEAEPNHEDRRWARVTARMGAMSRAIEEKDAEIAALRRYQTPQAAQPQQQLDPQIEQLIDQRAEAKAQQREEKRLADAFHEKAYEAFPDWDQRRANLVALGADAQIASLLIRMPDGYKVAGALSDDPDALGRIAAIDTPGGRAVALGQYAARLEAEPTRGQSRAPRPPAPLQGRSSPAPNPYTMQTTKDLVAFFRAEEMKKRSAG